MRRTVVTGLVATLVMVVLMEWVAAVHAASAEVRARYATWLLAVHAAPLSRSEVVGVQEVDAAGTAGPVQGATNGWPPLRIQKGPGVERIWLDPERLGATLGARVSVGPAGVVVAEPWPPELVAVPLVLLVTWVLVRRAPAPPNDLLANVSHELRTPLTSIIGYVEVLQGRAPDPLLEKVSRNAHALLEMINRLLDVSRINAGRAEMTIQSVPLGECVEAAWGMVEPQLQAKGLRFKVELPQEPLVVQGSFERLQQVFANLLSNAVKFTEQGEVGVRGGADGKMARIEVWDTGIGIAAKDVRHIFEEFRQADGSIRRRFGGSGLGLAICKKIVELHGGQLTVDSRPGAGSTFIVRIPLRRRRP